MTRKKCFKCGTERPLTEFYKHPQMTDGHVNKCKDCNKKDVSENRLKRLDYYRKYDAYRYQNDPSVRKRMSIVTAKWRKQNPDGYKAHSAVAYAVSTGSLLRGSCEVCGSDENVHGHHDDYLKPLEVRWLCAEHHRAHHISEHK